MQESHILSDGVFRMGPGTLYTTIQRLTGMGLLCEQPEESSDDSRRRYYELTGSGRKTLEAEVARMRSVVTLATSRLSPGTGKA